MEPVETSYHAMQRTRFAVTLAASCRLSARHAGAAQHSAVAELGVARRNHKAKFK